MNLRAMSFNKQKQIKIKNKNKAYMVVHDNNIRYILTNHLVDDTENIVGAHGMKWYSKVEREMLPRKEEGEFVPG